AEAYYKDDLKDGRKTDAVRRQSRGEDLLRLLRGGRADRLSASLDDERRHLVLPGLSLRADEPRDRDRSPRSWPFGQAEERVFDPRARGRRDRRPRRGERRPGSVGRQLDRRHDGHASQSRSSGPGDRQPDPQLGY